MSLASYTDLQTAISDWLNRDDLSAERIRDFIRLAENQIDLHLRARAMRTSFAANIGAGVTSVSIPADYLEMIQMQPTGAWVTSGSTTTVTATRLYPPMVVVPFNYLRALGDPIGGPPTFYAENPSGSTWDIWPADEQYQITIWYYARVTALSDASPTNALFLAQEDLYLSGALMEAEIYLKMPPSERGPWLARFQSIIERLNSESRRIPFTGSTPRTRPAYGNW